MGRLGLLLRGQEGSTEQVHPVPPNPLPGLQPRAGQNQLSCQEGRVKRRREATRRVKVEARASIAGNPPCHMPTSG